MLQQDIHKNGIHIIVTGNTNDANFYNQRLKVVSRTTIDF
jgi:hypothetical protein